jgi:hypothetical protein
MLKFLSTYWLWILLIGGMLFMHLGHGGHGGHGGKGGHGHGAGGHAGHNDADQPGTGDQAQHDPGAASGGDSATTAKTSVAHQHTPPPVA